jgi:hypothetical protein
MGRRMRTFEIVAGDFGRGEGTVTVGKQNRFVEQGLKMPRTDGSYGKAHYGLGQIEMLEIATEQSLKRMGGAIGWGFAGGLALGPIGALAGLLAGGRKNEVTFVCQFKDGKKFLGRAAMNTYTDIQAASFAPPPAVVRKPSETREPTKAEARLGYIVGGLLIGLVLLFVLFSK